MAKRTFEKFIDGKLVSPEVPPKKSQWSRFGINELAVRAYALMMLRELERHVPGDTKKEKHMHMEEILFIGTGFKKYAGGRAGKSIERLLAGNDPITFNIVKRAQRWLHDNGKALSPEAQDSLDSVTEVQHGKYLMELARYYRRVEKDTKRMLAEAEKTPHPAHARFGIAGVLTKLIPDDTSETLDTPARVKSYY